MKGSERTNVLSVNSDWRTAALLFAFFCFESSQYTFAEYLTYSISEVIKNILLIPKKDIFLQNKCYMEVA